MPTLDEQPSGGKRVRTMVFMCPVGPHIYETIGDQALGNEELDTVKCAKHEDADVHEGIA